MAGSTGFELLVGSAAFWDRAAGDMAAARRRLHVQAMTFEGDAAGRGVAAAIAASPAADRRVLVDSYSRWVVSDCFTLGPAAWFDHALREEVAATAAMFTALARGGAGVRVTNPVGPLFARWPARNHKKLIVADDVAYVGGINFSDHNFSWPDFMLRLEGGEAADALAADFEATFAGQPGAWRRRIGDLTLHSLDGRDNAAGFADIFALLEGASRRITVVSAYLTFPFTDALARAAARGVRVQLITPWPNNKPMVRNALLGRARRAGFEVALLPAMSHLKGLMIDETHLVVGSSNFDFVSLAAEEELMAVVTTPAVIEEFQRRIIEPALSLAGSPGAHRVSRLAATVCETALRVADLVARAASRSPRTAVDWSG